MPLIPAGLLPRRLAEARTRRAVEPPPQRAAAIAASGGNLPARAGFVPGIPPGGMDEVQGEFGSATASDRQTLLQELWESYLACPWSWACVNAIARTVTAGGLVTEWDADSAENEVQPEKPAEVLALERFLAFCNPEQSIRQIMRNVVADLLVFGDAYLEVVWAAGIPVALYNLDCPTLWPNADEHGRVSKYVQVTEFGQTAEFKPHQVIHISLDSARPAVFGVSPTAAAKTSIMTWMFFAACAKELARRGIPPTIHADHPSGTPDGEVTRWADQYVTRNIGPQNIGTPITTKGGGKVTELQSAKILDILKAKDQARDEIVCSYGVPPAKVGIIETGNLGGGTGSDQNKTFMLDTVWPIGELISEALQFAIAVKGFGVKGWHVSFSRTDYRDDKVIEDIRDLRVRNGTWTINRSRADAGEPRVKGGDIPVLVARQDVIAVSDIPAMSKATIAAKAGPAAQPGRGGGGGRDGLSGLGGLGGLDKAAESAAARVVAAHLSARRAVASRAELLEGRKKARKQVLAQLARSFPKDARAWAKHAEWSGPETVPWREIDLDHLREWAAVHDPGEVERLRGKLRRGGKPKPAVLVKRPGNRKMIIADGHHHALAALQENTRGLRAFAGKVAAVEGPWDMMHTRQKGGNR